MDINPETVRNMTSENIVPICGVSPDTHAISLLKNLCEQFGDGLFCDVQISIGESQFRAHKTVLCAASSYFMAMFTGGLRESSLNQVTIHQVQPKIFQNLLDFIYTGKLQITDRNCQDLLEASNMLQLHGARSLCCSFMKNQMHTSNCIGIQQFAESQGCMELSNLSTSFIHKHFVQVTKEEEFCHLAQSDLVNLLQSEKLRIEDEFQVFAAAMKWILFKQRDRRKHVFEVLSPVRFPIISTKKLDKYISDCPDLSLKIALKKMTGDFEHLRVWRDSAWLFMPRQCARRSVYVVGGYSREAGGRWSESESLAGVECLRVWRGVMWGGGPALQQARSGHGVCALGGAMYAVGGESCDSLIYDTAERLEPATNTWSSLPSMTTPRCGLGLCALDPHIYALGGWVGADIGRTVERYSPQLNTWEHWDTMTLPRFAMGVCEQQGLVYVVGGMSELGVELQTVESYCPPLREWSVLPPLSVSRAYVGVAVLDGCVYAVGGWNEQDGALQSVERYIVSEKRWAPVSAMACARAGAGVAALNGLLYVVGGRTTPETQSHPPATLKSVECYDPHYDSWTELEPMAKSRCEAGLAIL